MEHCIIYIILSYCVLLLTLRSLLERSTNRKWLSKNVFQNCNNIIIILYSSAVVRRQNIFSATLAFTILLDNIPFVQVLYRFFWGQGSNHFSGSLIFCFLNDYKFVLKYYSKWFMFPPILNGWLRPKTSSIADRLYYFFYYYFFLLVV